jgi:membrane protease YdiL (CAAX protease family)
MKKKDLFFCIAVIAIMILIRKVFGLFVFPNMELGVHDRELKKIIGGLLIIVPCIVFAKKREIVSAGGFIRPNARNFWMLLIPLLFPGLLFITGIELTCLDDIGFLTVTLAATFISALMEEVLFRGVIQGYLIFNSPLISPQRVCLITATFFSLAHLINLQYYELAGVLQQSVYAFYIGLLFSALLYRTNSVWMLGLAHGIVNFFSFRCDYTRIVPDGDQSSLIESSDLLSIVFAVILFSPILLIYWLLLKTMKRRNHESTQISSLNG